MIHTVTVNPALDLTFRVKELLVDDKIRATKVYRAAGGNGVNVSRVAARLGHPTVAMGFAGGRAGDEMTELLAQESVRTWFTHQAEDTRTNVILHDDENRQIRVSGPGAAVTPEEVEKLEASLFDLRAPDFLVLAGSLLKGMPGDFYLRLMARARADGVKVVADIDRELREVAAAGAHLIKPNQYELERLTGLPVGDCAQALAAGRRALALGPEVVVASLGPLGAVLVTQHEAWAATPPAVEVDSAVGAGDSLLAGVLIAIAEGKPWDEVLRVGVACGTATAMTPGTDLCHPETVATLLPEVRLERL
jgi:6-phosphofructokinase 2